MSASKRVEMWYSLQSDYCYFLINRLIRLADAGVELRIRPVLGLVLRMPESTVNRGQLEQDYFLTDTRRTAAFLKLPYAYPNPSPIEFEPDSLWVASNHQPRIERLYRLFVGATEQNRSLEFLDHVVRHLWDGTQTGWDESPFLYTALEKCGLDHDTILDSYCWTHVEALLSENHEAMLSAGHWGVPLMVYEGEPFYGQDRFDQLLWRMGLKLD